MFRPPRRRRPETPGTPAPPASPTLDYRDPKEDVRAGGGEGGDDDGGFLNPKANLRTLKKLAVELPVALVAEGLAVLLGLAVVIAVMRGCG